MGVKLFLGLTDGLLVGDKFEDVALLGLDVMSGGVSRPPPNNMLAVTNCGREESVDSRGLVVGENSSGRGRRGTDAMVALLFE